MKAKRTKWALQEFLNRDATPITVYATDFTAAYLECAGGSPPYVDDSYCIDRVFPANSEIPGACDDYFARMSKRRWEHK